MDENELEGVAEDIHKIVQYSLTPEAIFRRNYAKRMVSEMHRRYGDAVLLDLLVAVDNMDIMSSIVVLERSEIDNYLFAQYGVFDEDMFVKLQMTDSWDDFVAKVVGLSGKAAVDAIAEVMISEGIAGEDYPPE